MGLNALDKLARELHQDSDHAADGEPFGGPFCNCLRLAGSILPRLSSAWEDGRLAAITEERQFRNAMQGIGLAPFKPENPFGESS